MNRDDQIIEASLDEMLRLWRRWSQSETAGTGYPAVSATCKLYRSSRQHDYGAIDEDIDSTLAEGIDAQVQQIRDPWRTALAINARNIATGARVWRSARLPVDTEACAIVVMEARTQLMKRLHVAGLM